MPRSESTICKLYAAILLSFYAIPAVAEAQPTRASVRVTEVSSIPLRPGVIPNLRERDSSGISVVAGS
jgi:hypothetical protein